MARTSSYSSGSGRGPAGGPADRGILGWVLLALGMTLAFLFLPRIPTVFLRRRRVILMPRGPSRIPGEPTSVGMTNSIMVQAQSTVQGTIEQLNRGGIKIGGTWHNYPKGTAEQAKLSRELLGAFIVLSVLMVEGKSVIGSVQKLEMPKASADAAPAAPEPKPAEIPTPAAPVAPATAPEASPAPAAPAVPAWTTEPVTDVQKNRIEDLSKDLGLSGQVVNLILKLRYTDEAKAVAGLTKGEASKLIQYLDGDAPSLPARRRKY